MSGPKKNVCFRLPDRGYISFSLVTADPNFFAFSHSDIMFPYYSHVKILNKVTKKILSAVPILKFHAT